MLPEGRLLGHYRVVCHIGSGGMGEVYLAEDARINRQVAIKAVRIEAEAYSDPVATQDVARLFQREMQAITMLDHPHILPLYDFGEEKDGNALLRYMVMPLRQEGSLTDWLQKRGKSEKLTPSEVAHFVMQASEALQHAHERYLIHQDVKPSNFLVRSRSGYALPDLLLMDFGIAKMTTATATVSQHIRGTPAFMAPEQWKGRPQPATDQYALAIMAYLLLTGRTPFSGRMEQVMSQHFMDQPQPPSSLNPTLSPALDAVILRALAKEPEKRFPSILAFARAFQETLQANGNQDTTIIKEKVATNTNTDKPNSETTKPFPSVLRDHPNNTMSSWLRKSVLSSKSLLLTGGILGFISLLIILAIIIGPFMSMQRRPSVTPIPSDQVVEKWVFPTGDLVWSTPTVVDDVVYVGSNDTNLYAINARTGKQKWVFPTGNWVISSPTIQNGMLYIGSSDTNVYGIDANTGLEKLAFPTGEAVTSSPVIANGVLYVGSFDHKVYAIDASTAKQRWVFPTGDSIWGSPTVVNGIVYIGSYDHKLYAIDAATGQMRWTFPTGDKLLSSPILVNGIVYIGSFDDKVYAIDATTGQLRWAFPTGNAVQSTPTVVNGVLYVGSRDHKMYAIDAATGQLRWAFSTGGDINSSPTVVNGILYIGSLDHKVYAIDASTGHQKWAFSTGAAANALTVVNGVLYVGSDDHKVYALTLPVLPVRDMLRDDDKSG